jgi:predicted transcriptional regulator
MIVNQPKKKEDTLLLDLRKNIYSAIEKFPGIHFRELHRKINTGTGNLEYHLNYLQKANLIKVEKFGGHKRFYSLGLNDYERKILAILRQKNFRKIILKLLNSKTVIHKNIANYLKMSPSSVTWYLNKLIERNILAVTEKGREKYYQLKDKNEIIKIIINYKESFLDKLVDKFVDTWEA